MRGGGGLWERRERESEGGKNSTRKVKNPKEIKTRSDNKVPASGVGGKRSPHQYCTAGGGGSTGMCSRIGGCQLRGVAGGNRGIKKNIPTTRQK